MSNPPPPQWGEGGLQPGEGLVAMTNKTFGLVFEQVGMGIDHVEKAHKATLEGQSIFR